ncbi:hypothetical protein GQX73_g6611 [Xylaria multiplex]|uniref:Zn(2)-C6 fungal-type domain-containing protein n=1 Tax=Xylaria multiplex TaxID=323545 RepID=A0A7C8N2V2_9PEZI|nr:hypothetical protein GQX73_g6611 [Xylaria multiplex]
MEPAPGGLPTTTGRTQIACLNCAQAKTGCDKQTPACSRCREKGLPCEVRYARRSTKAAYRASQAAKKPSLPMPASIPPKKPLGMMTTVLDIDNGAAHHGPQVKAPVTPEEPPLTIDPRISHHDSPIIRGSPANSHLGSETIASPPTAIMDGMGEFMQYGNDILQQDPNYSGMWPWGEILEFDLYNNDTQQTQGDVPMSTFPDLNSIISSNSENVCSSIGSTHTRSTSIMSTKEFEPASLEPKPANRPEVRDMGPEVVIASESGWPLARCNPVIYSGSCPRTAIIHLECLERKSKNEGTWNALEGFLDLTQQDGTDMASVVPMNPRTRDHMLAITQTFLIKALEIHRGGFQPQSERTTSPALLTFLVLPPAKILEYFLRSYVRNLSFFYSLVSTGPVDPNVMMHNNLAGTLLVLLMIAQGASVVPREEARTLSIGLVETCRISLFDIIEKNVELCADPTVHRCSLLFTLLGAWSGDKWLMDISMGQRGMYLSMLKHAGMFEAQPSIIPSFNNPTSLELAWRSWVDQEIKNRLVYNWVMVDQELSLFHDTAPILAIGDLCAPVPGPEEMWMSENADQWMAAMQANMNGSANVGTQLPSLTPSLYALFQDFLHDNLTGQRAHSLTPHQLRLLLHPLQSLLWHLRESILYCSDTLNMRDLSSRTVNKNSSMLRQDKIQDLLQKWYMLSQIHYQTNPACAVSKTNLVLFHLISLNAVSNFPAIERLARRERNEGAWGPPQQRGPYIHAIEEAIYHCGQVVRLVRAMAADRRPIWWSAALYRAMLILWAYSVLRRDPNFLQNRETESFVVINEVGDQDQGLFQYMWEPGPKAIPVLSGVGGKTISLTESSDILEHAVIMLNEGLSSRFNDGIKRKLITLNRNWTV